MVENRKHHFSAPSNFSSSSFSPSNHSISLHAQKTEHEAEPPPFRRGITLVALTCPVQAVSDRLSTPVFPVPVLHNNVSFSPADLAEPMILVP
ncbi:hypothetical protein TRIATDRAFT_160652 [Trichoderma atroviride IMI 206040]|uniref:Uncharacterized protein n=1 Tax=Hypocrea atroviridis (strain ATCC 20476 / IMI 206040) TaxID=452589 RepID=G9NPP3_HYPAI|nr:uncharacterized protein TRIATDRAFT_160652 [Trichoderma atroviride IMI 206040]EHK47509.1 hypothetical protein TRIATDRAFT_160652 [Trichoderma atroviride IMI 206040]